MLKRNKVISIYAISAIILIATVGILTSTMLETSTVDTTQKFQEESRPPSVLIGDYGQTVGMDIAKEKAGFRISTVKAEQSSPAPLVKTNSDGDVFQIYSLNNKPVDDQTSLSEVMANGGLVIWEEKLGDNVNVSTIIKAYEQNKDAQVFNVQGLQAIATQIQPESDIPNLLHVFRYDGVRVTLMSNQPVDELVKIAESMDLSFP